MNDYWFLLDNAIKQNIVLKPKGDLRYRSNKSIEGSSILAYMVMIHISKNILNIDDEEIAYNLSITINKYKELLDKTNDLRKPNHFKFKTKLNLCQRFLEGKKILK
tara:strand:- start:1619 stop:1936 length:318 start_codon:yes stop_codon:yes gene_type:complete